MEIYFLRRRTHRAFIRFLKGSPTLQNVKNFCLRSHHQCTTPRTLLIVIQTICPRNTGVVFVVFECRLNLFLLAMLSSLDILKLYFLYLCLHLLLWPFFYICVCVCVCVWLILFYYFLSFLIVVQVQLSPFFYLLSSGIIFSE